MSSTLPSPSTRSPHHRLATAAWTYLMPLTSSRGFKLAVVGTALVLLLAAASFALGFVSDAVSESLLQWLGRMVVLPGLPIAAVILAEMPLRDGIRHRTLLYPLLGPVARAELALVRTAITAALLALSSTIIVTVLHVAGASYPSLPRTLLGVALASFMYVPLFGLGHLVTNRGLALGFLFFVLVDYPLGRVPFAISGLAPSRHVRVVTEQFNDFVLVVQLSAGREASLALSIGVLVLVAAVTAALVAFVFRSRNLGELC